MLADRYKILKEFKDGGFSQTFLVRDLHHPEQQRCVIKKLQSPDSDAFTINAASQLFTQEVNILKKLGHHAQIPQLYTTFTEGGEIYLVEEFIMGHSLAQELRWGLKWGEARVLELLQSILTPLAFVHRQGVIHRDLKPENLIRRQQDQSVVLIDFGSIQNYQVCSGAVVGTDGYMPPEQLQGSPLLCSDVYAVGMVALRALTGINPNKRAFELDPQTGDPIWRHHRTVSSDLADMIDTMICRDVLQRYRSASEALRSVNTLIEQRGGTAAPTRRRLFQVAGYGVLGVLGTGIVMPAFLSESEADRPKSSTFSLSPMAKSSSRLIPRSEQLPDTPLIPVPAPLGKDELIERYGSYNECCAIAKAKGINFKTPPTWDDLAQAFSYSDAIAEFSHRYLATFPSSTLTGIKVEVNL